jgi:hypothetical protein
MATNPVDFLLNKSPAAPSGDPVGAPAFSLTKVLSSAAIVVTPLATLLVDQFTKLSFTSGQIVALTVAILGFLAIASAADVLARAISASADSRAKAVTAAAADSGTVMLLEQPLAARLISAGEDPRVSVLAVRGGPHNRVLVAQDGGGLSWVDEKQVYYAKAKAKAGPKPANQPAAPGQPNGHEPAIQ